MTNEEQLALRINAFERRIADLERIAQVGAWTAYVPTWTAAFSAPAIGDGILIGRWRKTGKTLRIHIFLGFGSTTTGGTGAWTLSLPTGVALPSSSPGQTVGLVKTYQSGPGWNMIGFAYVAGGSTTINPFVPVSNTSSVLTPAQNADVTVAVGTGNPNVAGQYSFVTGSNLNVELEYEVV